jgi:hypothetical protein
MALIFRLMIILVLGGPLLLLPGQAAWPQTSSRPAPASFHGFYLLSFDRYGALANRFERDLAIEELKANRQIDRIIIMSYGWANDGEASFAAYQNLIMKIRKNSPRPGASRTTAIFGIGWDSSQTGFRKLITDILPLPVIGDALAFFPDTLLFPVSFWSKAAMADRIGYGGLRNTLNQIFAEVYPEGESHPEIYLIGHSFGTRILSGLMQEELGFLPVPGEKFESAAHVKGAVMLQPALVADNLHRDAPYPVLVTQSRHDHANGLLYPVANLVVNAYSFTAVEAHIQKRLFATIEGMVGAASGSVSRAASQVKGIVLPSKPEANEAPEGDEEVPPENLNQTSGLFTGLPVQTYRATRRSVGELMSIPIGIFFNAVMTPLAYGYAQTKGVLTHPLDHLMDSLAQIPVVEIPVDGLSRIVGREVPWGQRGKGVFDIGPLNEAVGRLATSNIKFGGVPPVYSPQELHEVAGRDEGCGLPQCEGLVIVDASRLVVEGLFGNLDRPLLDYTLGWFDLIGAHSDYTNPEVVRLMTLVVNAPVEKGHE